MGYSSMSANNDTDEDLDPRISVQGSDWNQFHLRLRDVMLFASVLGGAWLLVELVAYTGLIEHLSVEARILVVLLAATTSLVVTLLFRHTLLLRSYRTLAKRKASPQPPFGEPVKLLGGRERKRTNFADFIAAAAQRIDLMGLSLAPFATEACADQFFEAVTRRGVRVRVLLLNPLSMACSKRPAHLYRGILPLSESIIESIRFFLRLEKRLTEDSKQHADMLDVRVYTEMPTISAFFRDNEVNFAPYVMTRTGLSSPCIIIDGSASEEDSVYHCLQEHFDVTFSSAIQLGSAGWVDKVSDAAESELESSHQEARSKIEERLGRLAQ